MLPPGRHFIFSAYQQKTIHSGDLGMSHDHLSKSAKIPILAKLFVFIYGGQDFALEYRESFWGISMALEVIGVGQGRTGTASVKVALEHLSIGRCYHMGEAVSIPGASDLWVDAADGNPNWRKIFDGFNAAVDNPICAFWRELADHYPDAKILLTMRDAQKWFESTQATIYAPETLDFILGTDFREFLEKTTYTLAIAFTIATI